MAAEVVGEVCAGVAAGDRGDLLGSALGDDAAARVAAAGAEVDDQSAVLMTSRLCSMTITVLPWLTSACSTSSSFFTSS